MEIQLSGPQTSDSRLIQGTRLLLQQLDQIVQRSRRPRRHAHRSGDFNRAMRISSAESDLGAPVDIALDHHAPCSGVDTSTAPSNPPAGSDTKAGTSETCPGCCSQTAGRRGRPVDRAKPSSVGQAPLPSRAVLQGVGDVYQAVSAISCSFEARPGPAPSGSAEELCAAPVFSQRLDQAPFVVALADAWREAALGEIRYLLLDCSAMREVRRVACVRDARRRPVIHRATDQRRRVVVQDRFVGSRRRRRSALACPSRKASVVIAVVAYITNPGVRRRAQGRGARAAEWTFSRLPNADRPPLGQSLPWAWPSAGDAAARRLRVSNCR